MQPTPSWVASRTVGWVVVASLVIAALVAIGSILGGGFSSNDGKVIATSVGFGVFTATGSAGSVLRSRDPERFALLSLGTVVLSAASFVFLLIALWGGDSEGVVRWFASTAVAALGCSYVCLTIAGSHPTDGSTVDNLRAASIILAALASFLGIVAAAGLDDDPSGGYWKLVAVVVVLLLLTTTLVPVLRRLERQPAVPAATPTTAPAPISAPSASPTHTPAPLPFTTEVLATAARIEALTAGDEAVQRELARLRELARFYG